MAKSPNWTPEELALLSEKYPYLGKCEELQKLFPNRNLSAITLKASRIGLKVINNIRIGRTNQEYLDLLENTNFVAIEEYKGSTVPIMHMCSICEYEWLVRPQQVLKIGAKCPVCSHKDRFNSLCEVDNTLHKANLIRLSDYTGSLDKLLVKHTTCSYEWWTVYSYIEQGSGCPKCNRGFGYRCSTNIPDTASLYLFKITTNTEVFLKIGITCRPIHIRLRELKSSIGLASNPRIEVLASIVNTGNRILDIEWELLHKYQRYNSTVYFDGYKELVKIEDLEEIMKDISKYGNNI